MHLVRRGGLLIFDADGPPGKPLLLIGVVQAGSSKREEAVGYSSAATFCSSKDKFSGLGDRLTAIIALDRVLRMRAFADTDLRPHTRRPGFVWLHARHDGWSPAPTGS